MIALVKNKIQPYIKLAVCHNNTTRRGLLGRNNVIVSCYFSLFYIVNSHEAFVFAMLFPTSKNRLANMLCNALI